MKNIEESITIHYTKMSKTDKAIFEQILAAPKKFVGLSIHDLSKDLQVSSPTLLRAARKIGYSGYPEFKLALEEYVREEKISLASPSETLLTSIISTYEKSLAGLKEGNLEKDILEIVDWMNEAADIKIIGIGNSALPAQQLVYSLYSQGKFYEAITTETQIYFLQQALNEKAVYFIYSVSALDYYENFIELANSINAKTVLVTMNKDAKINSKPTKTIVLPATSTFLRNDGSLRQLDMRLELFLFSEIVSYYYDWITDKQKKSEK
ncbi:MurR/RpiR family transcriptional regulator [Enterococcus sp. AZ196]|uniref:MurR/RpiR family transcriptional regulator n=1 Tax=Enterococcus sp. AZ196 TaxID=2774659 RepID=UPI003D2B549F